MKKYRKQHLSKNLTSTFCKSALYFFENMRLSDGLMVGWLDGFLVARSYSKSIEGVLEFIIITLIDGFDATVKISGKI
jgi:hypothetical protein